MRLIDADKIFQKVKGSTASKAVKCLAEVLVATAPTIDAVAVTRCKDCKYRDGTPGQPNIICSNMHDNDFCSYGEPKEANHA